MSTARELVVYIACSLDGYIATKDDDLSFLARVEAPPEDYGYKEFIDTVDTVIIGRRTYEKLLTFDGPFWHAARDTYVISRTRTGKDANVTFRSDAIELVHELKAKPGKRIFCDGGAEIVHVLQQARLIDRYVVSFIPVLLGDGIRLFRPGFAEQMLKLVRSQAYPSGLVQVEYVTA